jgi:hypothetical protein
MSAQSDEPTTEEAFQNGWVNIDPNGRWKRLTTRAMFEIENVGTRLAPHYALFIAQSGEQLHSDPDNPDPLPTLEAAQTRAWQHYQRM